MIAFLEGVIAELDPTYVIINCNGVGYLVKISLYTYGALRELKTVKLHTHLQVREDAHILYGFSEIRERKLFEHLISVSGIGGNTALMVLSSLSPEEVAHAIVTANEKLLQSIKGIGGKTAGRLILELKDKVKLDQLSGGKFSAENSSTSIAFAGLTKRDEALRALVNLGFPKATMEKTLDTILKREGEDIAVEQLIKFALKGG
ncbi:MAG: Holliday junction branch migration protein RuvA [Sphingobacteriia bacterium]|nr:Holliday junction branch migration protein RuvA [Sphingobacteriia bacterium]